MKKIISLISILISTSVLASTALVTDNFVVTKQKYDSEKKIYLISLTQMAGVYKADEKVIKCLQHSLSSKKAAKITYEAMGLKITDCSI